MTCTRLLWSGDSIPRVIDTQTKFFSGDLNDKLIEGRYSIAISDDSSVVNFPKGAYGYGNLIVLKSLSSVTQIYTPHSCDFIYMRVKFDSNWSKWKKVQTQVV